MFKIYYVLMMALSLAGCTYLPADGPRHDDILGAATVSTADERRKVAYDYVLINVSDKVIESMADVGPGSFFRTFGAGHGPAPTIMVGVGDILAITIFESASGGLFIPPEAGVRPGNFVTLPSQTVSKAGTISIPYAGEVRAAGRTPDQIKADIERLLGARAVEPQVIVTLVEQTAMSVTLVGESSSGRLQVRPNERILDIVARGSVKSHPGYELFVTLQRKGLRATVYLPLLVNDPRENIFVAPGDTLYVYREQQKFVALGALGAGGVTSGLTGLFPFEQERLSLNEGLAKAGGLIDARSNPHVLLYRMEYREVLERIGLDISQFGSQPYIPTIYRTNLKDPSAFFIAQRFPMRHKDVIYAASANSVELEKFMAHSRSVTNFVAGTAADALITRDVIRAFGN